MNEEPTELTLRASAYLDGELDAAEMVRAGADPALMAEVEELRALQALVRDTEPPTAAARDRALTAALAEFDTLHPPALHVRPRPAYGRWLGIAAAVVAIGLLGTVIATSSSGDDDSGGDAALQASDDVDESSRNFSSQSEAPAADAFDTAAAGGAAEEASADSASESATAEAASVLAADQAPAPEAVATEAPAATMAPSAPELDASGAPATTAAAEASQFSIPGFDPTVPIADEVALGVIGRQMLDDLSVERFTPATDLACTDAAPPFVALADALLIVGQEVIAIVVAGDPSTFDTVALDPDSCAVTATGR